MGLRLGEGVDLSALSLRVEMARDDLVDAKAVTQLVQLGLVHDGERLTVTPAGTPLLDRILAEIVTA